MAASSRSRVFSAYRRLFRARAKLFQGDQEAIQESGRAIRQQFMQNKAAPTSGEHFEGLLSMVDEAEDMLLTGFVQGKLNDDGHYHVAIKPEHTGDAKDMAAVPQLEPVTENTVQRMKGVQVDVTACANKQGGDIAK
jgi:complex III assembly factor LYRM7